MRDRCSTHSAIPYYCIKTLIEQVLLYKIQFNRIYYCCKSYRAHDVQNFVVHTSYLFLVVWNIFKAICDQSYSRIWLNMAMTDRLLTCPHGVCVAGTRRASRHCALVTTGRCWPSRRPTCTSRVSTSRSRQRTPSTSGECPTRKPSPSRLTPP